MPPIAEWFSTMTIYYLLLCSVDHTLLLCSSASMVLVWATVILWKLTFAGGYWDSWICFCFWPCDLLYGFNFSLYCSRTWRMFWPPSGSKSSFCQCQSGKQLNHCLLVRMSQTRLKGKPPFKGRKVTSTSQWAEWLRIHSHFFLSQ